LKLQWRELKSLTRAADREKLSLLLDPKGDTATAIKGICLVPTAKRFWVNVSRAVFSRAARPLGDYEEGERRRRWPLAMRAVPLWKYEPRGLISQSWHDFLYLYGRGSPTKLQ
jgi:hypothetical protein